METDDLESKGLVKGSFLYQVLVSYHHVDNSADKL